MMNDEPVPTTGIAAQADRPRSPPQQPGGHVVTLMPPLGKLVPRLRHIVVLSLLAHSACSSTLIGDTNAAAAPASAPTVYEDGAGNAPPGAPQLPNLLKGYRHPPPWRVAGVDYAVGIPSGKSLKDPTTIVMPGVSLDRLHHFVRVTGNGVTLDGYDFSLHGGWGVYIDPGASGTLITNSKFMAGANNVIPIAAQAGAGSLTVQYCSFDGGGANSNSVWTLINYNGSGSFLAQYDLFENAPEDAIDFSAGTVSPTIQYNLFKNLGTEAGSHADPVQYVGGVVDNAVEQFNTIYQPQGLVPVGMQGLQIAAQRNARITNTALRNNVIISTGPLLTMSYLIAIVSDGTSSLDGAIVSNNYLDTSGAYGAFYPPRGDHLIFTANWNMVTGRAFRSPPGTR